MTPLLGAWMLLGLALPLSIAGANAGWILVLLALFIDRRKTDLSQARTPLATPLVFYCAIALAACALSMAPSVSFPLLRKDLHKLWLCLLFSLGLSALPAEQDSFLQRALAAGLAVAATVGIGQAIYGRWAQGAWARAHAFIHPVSFGEILAFGVLGGICACAAPADTSVPKTASTRSAALLFIVWTFCGLILSQTRGALLGLAAGLTAVGLFMPGLRPWFLGGATTAIGGAAAADLLGSSGSAGRSILRTFVSFSGPNFARLTLWRAAWYMFLTRPWLGIGPGNFREQIAQFYPGRIDGEYHMGSAHNLFLHQLAERGVLGLTALVILFWILGQRSYARVKANPESRNLWAFSATAAFTVMNLTETAFQTEQVWMLFFLIWLWSEKRHQAWEHAK